MLISFLQYFLNSKVAKEPVPPQLEQIAKEVLVPLLAVFHHLVEKVVVFILPLCLLVVKSPWHSSTSLPCNGLFDACDRL